MKKNIIGSLLLSALVLSTGATALAAPSTGVEVDPGTKEVKSTVKVKVIGGDTDPTKPVDPNPDPGTTDQEGPLSIDQVLVFNFSEYKLGSKTARVSMAPIKNETKVKPANIQVTDKRGTGSGWNLQIKQSELVAQTDGGERILKGAYIDMNLPTVKSAPTNSDPEEKPVAVPYNPNYGTKGQFAKILQAEKDKGMGTWLSYYNEKDEVVNAQTGQITTPGNFVKLVIPTGNYAGDYVGTVTWMLSESPEANPA